MPDDAVCNPTKQMTMTTNRFNKRPSFGCCFCEQQNQIYAKTNMYPQRCIVYRNTQSIGKQTAQHTQFILESDFITKEHFITDYKSWSQVVKQRPYVWWYINEPLKLPKKVHSLDRWKRASIVIIFLENEGTTMIISFFYRKFPSLFLKPIQLGCKIFWHTVWGSDVSNKVMSNLISWQIMHIHQWPMFRSVGESCLAQVAQYYCLPTLVNPALRPMVEDCGYLSTLV